MESAYVLIHLVCRLGMESMIPDPKTIDFMDCLVDPTGLAREYEYTIQASCAMRGDPKYVNETLSNHGLALACYGGGYETASLMLKDRIKENPAMLSDVVYYSANGGHYQVRQFLPSNPTMSQFLNLEDAMERTFIDRDWRTPIWVTEQEVAAIIEFFHSIGLSYQTISLYAANDPLALRYLATKDVDWYKCLKRNSRVRNTLALVDAGLIEWNRVSVKVIKDWDDKVGVKGRVLLRYLLVEKMESQDTLIASALNSCNEDFIEAAMAVIDTSHVSRTVTQAINTERLRVLDTLVKSGLAQWKDVIEEVMESDMTPKLAGRIAKSVTTCAKRKRDATNHDT